MKSYVCFNDVIRIEKPNEMSNVTVFQAKALMTMTNPKL